VTGYRYDIIVLNVHAPNKDKAMTQRIAFMIN